MFGPMKAQRDEEFSQFVTDAQSSLSGTAWLLTGNREQADDLVQSALVKTYVAWPKVRRADALAYARRTLVNENIDRWRSRRPEVLDDDPASSLAALDAHEHLATHDEVARLVRRLPEGQRKVIVLRYFCDMTEREIAESLNISPAQSSRPPHAGWPPCAPFKPKEHLHEHRL